MKRRDFLILLAASTITPSLLWELLQRRERIAITFDVDPDALGYTKGGVRTFLGVEKALPVILRRLGDIPLTFFVTGEVARKYPEVVARLAERYSIGSHSFSHPNLTKVSPERLWWEVYASKKEL